MFTVKQVGYKGAHGVFDGDRAVGQPGAEETMRAIAHGLNTGVLPNQQRKRGQVLVGVIVLAGVLTLVFLLGQMVTCTGPGT